MRTNTQSINQHNSVLFLNIKEFKNNNNYILYIIIAHAPLYNSLDCAKVCSVLTSLTVHLFLHEFTIDVQIFM